MLKDIPTWIKASKASREAFVRAAEDVRYGPQQTSNAWNWFYAGWLWGKKR